MPAISMSQRHQEELLAFLKKNRKCDLVTAYLYFLGIKHQIHPVLFLREKTIYRGKEDLISKLEEQGKLWRETEIKIQFGKESVNEQTQKIYICPHTGKVFGDNTHPNPQDAIYDWVSTCPENKERINGLRVKRFFVSEDPEIIKNYIIPRKAAVSKIVFSSAITGKLFNSKQSVIEDFLKNQLKPVDLIEVPNQNRYQIEEELLRFIQTEIEESKISSFVEAVSGITEFEPYVNSWLDNSAE